MTKRLNHLAMEKSPYLLQHADNPVDWYPWGEEALEKARRENKPIFLSIGYSTCHWCHVMAHESFEDPEVAKLLNDTFVCIKVDREERPDLDQIYMSVCQMMTGSGGWPLTIILTPDLKPFYADTYIPKTSRFGKVGLLDLIPRIRELWQKERERVLASADEIAAQLRRALSAPVSGASPDAAVLDEAYRQLREEYDPIYGGFGRAPKFPTPHNFLFLLRYWDRTGASEAVTMVVETLRRMRRGGIYDQLGYGFHRYSTDREWLVPHFEKMLYDQALLLLAYTEAYLVTGEEEFRRVVDELVTYLLREMQDPEGGFYSAEDADSEGEEGKFYLWTADEVRRALKPDEFELAVQAYGLREEGNYVDPVEGGRTGRNILHLAADPTSLARQFGLDEAELREKLEGIRAKLFAARQKRVPPSKDDKILTDWNGLAIAGLSAAGRATGDRRALKAAERAARFVLTHLRREDGSLLHRYRDGEAGIAGFLDDYAFLMWGLTELYLSTYDAEYLEAAVQLAQRMLSLFQDPESGAFYLTAEDSRTPLTRPRETYDGAVPSGAAVATYDLLRLGRLTGRTQFEEAAQRSFESCWAAVARSPAGHTFWLCAFDFALGPGHEVVIASPEGSTDFLRFTRELEGRFQPRTVTLVKRGEDPRLAAVAPFTKDYKPLSGRTAAYVCQNFACQAPTTDPAKMLEYLLGGKTSELRQGREGAQEGER